MRTLLFSLALTASLAVGCKKTESDKTSTPASEKVPADNTGRNDRDKAAAPTADQAAQGGTDLDLTAKIRKAIMSADGLSTNAQNAKIVVDKGVVTLVGPVASDAERARLASIATDAGAASVVNQLEVAK